MPTGAPQVAVVRKAKVSNIVKVAKVGIYHVYV